MMTHRLMAMINKTDSYFVRCICSNYLQKGHVFDAPVVMNQLRCTGIIDCVRIR